MKAVETYYSCRHSLSVAELGYPCQASCWNCNSRSRPMLAFFLFLSLIVGPAFSQNKSFPFGPRRRILPGQRSSGCSDCAAELKQCILTCVEKFDCSEMNVKAEWYRYQTVACLVTSSSPVPLKTRRVGQRCTLNLSRAEMSSRWCGVVVRRGGASSGVVHFT
ncbi:uncharacterized protein TNCV_876211 [Trichonephila clavipes]|nr:uncharacterized protein TNCV_876211 [Trichonephila clavipes]